MQIKLDLVQVGIWLCHFLSLIVASQTDQHSTQQILTPDALLTDFEAFPISTSDIVLDKNCAAKSDIINLEFKVALSFAKYTSTKFTNDNPYVKAFWPEIFFGKEQWMTYGGDYFKHVVQVGSDNDDNKRPYPNDPTKQLKVTCEETPTCSLGNVVAHTDTIKGIINFCHLWDTLPNSRDIECVDGRQLSRYESKARAIVHELTHLQFSPGFPLYGGPADDVRDRSGPPQYAYGVTACMSLAAGTFGTPMVSIVKALENADTWAWIAAGTVWLERCQRKTGNNAFQLPLQ